MIDLTQLIEQDYAPETFERELIEVLMPLGARSSEESTLFCWIMQKYLPLKNGDIVTHRTLFRTKRYFKYEMDAYKEYCKARQGKDFFLKAARKYLDIPINSDSYTMRVSIMSPSSFKHEPYTKICGRGLYLGFRAIATEVDGKYHLLWKSADVKEDEAVIVAIV